MFVVPGAGQSVDALHVLDRESQCASRFDDPGVAHRGLETPRLLGVEQGGRAGREVPDHGRARGRGVDGAADAEGDAQHLAGVEVQEARLLVVGVEDQLGGGHRLDVRRHRHRQTHRLGDHPTDRCGLPAEPRMVDEATLGDQAADRDADPEDTLAGPTLGEAAGADADGGEDLLGVLGDQDRDLDRADDAVQQVVGGDRGDLVADVDAQGEEVGEVDLERQAQPAVGARRGELSRSRMRPAFSRALTWRFTVEMESPVRSAASSRNRGPARRNTEGQTPPAWSTASGCQSTRRAPAGPPFRVRAGRPSRRGHGSAEPARVRPTTARSGDSPAVHDGPDVSPADASAASVQYAGYGQRCRKAWRS